MALDAAIYSQDSLGYFFKEFYTLGGGANGGWRYGFGLQEEMGFVEMLDSFMDHSLLGNWESSSSSAVIQNVKDWDPNSSPEACTADQRLFVEGGSPMMEEQPSASASVPAPPPAGKRKRRCTRTCKNEEELENQRMNHIAVERNRRKQMNDYLAVIRSLMPSSYVQRGDQASIVGGAINFVKELEQHLQTLEAQKGTINQEQLENGMLPLFADFFTYPQYSTRSPSSNLHFNINSPVTTTTNTSDQPQPRRAATENRRPALAEIEVKMAESHANLKVLSKKRPRQLLKLVAGLQCLWLTILHLNVTTLDQRVLYSISVKLEEGCQLTTVDEIADAVNHLLGRIEEEAV